MRSCGKTSVRLVNRGSVSDRLRYRAMLHIIGLILGLRPANERRRYFVMMSLIGWAQTWNQPWEMKHPRLNLISLDIISCSLQFTQCTNILLEKSMLDKEDSEAHNKKQCNHTRLTPWGPWVPKWQVHLARWLKRGIQSYRAHVDMTFV